MTCTAEKHGTAWAMRTYGCRCPEARADKARETKQYRKKRYLNAGERLRVPNVGALRRKQALARMGWTEPELARRMGGSAPRPRQRGNIRNVNPETHAWWVEAYERYCMTEGPSRRVMAIAVTKGWAPPMAWLDIDDPDELPALTDTAYRETLKKRKVAARKRRNKRARVLRAAGYTVPAVGTVPTLTQYERRLAAKSAAARAARKEDAA